MVLRTELLSQLRLHPRDLRFSTPTALRIRDPGFILRLCVRACTINKIIASAKLSLMEGSLISVV